MSSIKRIHFNFKPSSVKGQNNTVTANYDNQQGSVVLKNAFTHWNDIAISAPTWEPVYDM